MADKRYYWLKLDENFFEDDTIAWLEEQENGKDYVFFYLKLALKSLQDEGRLIRYVGETLIPYDVKALAKLTNTPIDTVAIALKTFVEIGLIARLDTGEIYLNQINEMIGNETDVAKRVRRHRAKKMVIGQQKTNLLQCNTDVTKCNTEIEIEKEIDIDKEIEIKKNNYQQIADMYNEICISFPRLTKLSDARKKAIKARLNTYKVEDFKKLFKLAEESDFLKGKNDRNWSATFDWLIKDANMAKVLDGNYKAKSVKKVVSNNKFNNLGENQRSYEMDSLEKQLLGGE